MKLSTIYIKLFNLENYCFFYFTNCLFSLIDLIKLSKNNTNAF